MSWAAIAKKNKDGSEKSPQQQPTAAMAAAAEPSQSTLQTKTPPPPPSLGEMLNNKNNNNKNNYSSAREVGNAAQTLSSPPKTALKASSSSSSPSASAGATMKMTSSETLKVSPLLCSQQHANVENKSKEEDETAKSAAASKTSNNKDATPAAPAENGNNPTTTSNAHTPTPASAGSSSSSGFSKLQSLFRKRQNPVFNRINSCFIVSEEEEGDAKQDGASNHGKGEATSKTIPPPTTVAELPPMTGVFPHVYISNLGGATAVFRDTPPYISPLSPMNDLLKLRNIRVVVTAVAIQGNPSVQGGKGNDCGSVGSDKQTVGANHNSDHHHHSLLSSPLMSDVPVPCPLRRKHSSGSFLGSSSSSLTSSPGGGGVGVDAATERQQHQQFRYPFHLGFNGSEESWEGYHFNSHQQQHPPSLSASVTSSSVANTNNTNTNVVSPCVSRSSSMIITSPNTAMMGGGTMSSSTPPLPATAPSFYPRNYNKSPHAAVTTFPLSSQQNNLFFPQHQQPMIPGGGSFRSFNFSATNTATNKQIAATTPHQQPVRGEWCETAGGGGGGGGLASIETINSNNNALVKQNNSVMSRSSSGGNSPDLPLMMRGRGGGGGAATTSTAPSSVCPTAAATSARTSGAAAPPPSAPSPSAVEYAAVTPLVMPRNALAAETPPLSAINNHQKTSSLSSSPSTAMTKQQHHQTTTTTTPYLSAVSDNKRHHNQKVSAEEGGVNGGDKTPPLTALGQQPVQQVLKLHGAWAAKKSNGNADASDCSDKHQNQLYSPPPPLPSSYASVVSSPAATPPLPTAASSLTRTTSITKEEQKGDGKKSSGESWAQKLVKSPPPAAAAASDPSPKSAAVEGTALNARVNTTPMMTASSSSLPLPCPPPPPPVSPETIARLAAECASIRAFLPSCPDYYVPLPKSGSSKKKSGGKSNTCMVAAKTPAGEAMESVVNENVDADYDDAETDVAIHLRPYPVYIRLNIHHRADASSSPPSPPPASMMASASKATTDQNPTNVPAAVGAGNSEEKDKKESHPAPALSSAPSPPHSLAPPSYHSPSAFAKTLSDSEVDELIAIAETVKAHEEQLSEQLTRLTSAASNASSASQRRGDDPPPTTTTTKSELHHRSKLITASSSLPNDSRSINNSADTNVVMCTKGKEAWHKKHNVISDAAATTALGTALPHPPRPDEEHPSPPLPSIPVIHVPFYYIHVPVEDNQNTRLQWFLLKLEVLLGLFAIDMRGSEEERDKVNEKDESKKMADRTTETKTAQPPKTPPLISLADLVAQKNKTKPTQQPSKQNDVNTANTTAPLKRSQQREGKGKGDDETKHRFNLLNKIIFGEDHHDAQRQLAGASLLRSTTKTTAGSSSDTPGVPTGDEKNNGDSKDRRHLLMTTFQATQTVCFGNQAALRQQLLPKTTKKEESPPPAVCSLRLPLAKSHLKTTDRVDNKTMGQSQFATHSSNQPPTTTKYIPSSILVHCLQGVSRSASIAIGFLMLFGCDERKTSTDNDSNDAPQTQNPFHKPLSYSTALNSLIAARNVANPNPFFRAQLVKFEDCLRDIAAEAQVNSQ